MSSLNLNTPKDDAFYFDNKNEHSLGLQIDSTNLPVSPNNVVTTSKNQLDAKVNLSNHLQNRIDSVEPEFSKKFTAKERAIDRIHEWLRQKRKRAGALYSTTSYLFENKKFSVLAKHGYLFLKGERHNVKNVPSLNSFNRREFEKNYQEWIKNIELKSNAIDKQISSEISFNYRPLITILINVDKGDAKFLEKTIQSIITQTYSNWELFLFEICSNTGDVGVALENYSKIDNRIKATRIASAKNATETLSRCLELTNGEFVALLNQADKLAPNALFENIKLLNDRFDADFIYSDEDQANTLGKRSNPIFKPDWSPDFFYSSGYTGHFGVYRKRLIESAIESGFEFQELQNYEMVLSVTEQSDKIYHIPKILYHSFKKKASMQQRVEEKNIERIKTLSKHFKRLKIQAKILPGLAGNLLRVKRLITREPKVSIIIPTRDKVEFLRNCLDSIQSRTTYSNYEIIIVNNQSIKPETLAYFKQISTEPNIKILEFDQPFNFSAINNLAAKEASGELLLFLNNDTEVISFEWLHAMVEQAIRPEVGAVGSLLLYPDGRIQHAGVILGIGGVAGHSHKYLSKKCPGYLDRTKAIQNFSAVTAACMMVRAEVFQSSGGFDEQQLAVSYNDLDFCLRLRQKNFLVVYTPYAELLHYESVSRYSDQIPKNAVRSKSEKDFMLNYWKETLLADPYYNPNLSLEKEDFSLEFKPRK